MAKNTHPINRSIFSIAKVSDSLRFMDLVLRVMIALGTVLQLLFGWPVQLVAPGTAADELDSAANMRRLH